MGKNFSISASVSVGTGLPFGAEGTASNILTCAARFAASSSFDDHTFGLYYTQNPWQMEQGHDRLTGHWPADGGRMSPLPPALVAELCTSLWEPGTSSASATAQGTCVAVVWQDSWMEMGRLQLRQ